jgi:hypothetical protein
MPRISKHEIGGVSDDLYQRAVSRVERSPKLRKFRGIILHDYGGRHWQWVIYAPVREIESWAQQIKEDSDG